MALSNFAEFDVDPNTGEAEAPSRRSRIAVDSLFVDFDRPSHLALSVVPDVDLPVIIREPAPPRLSQLPDQDPACGAGEKPMI